MTSVYSVLIRPILSEKSSYQSSKLNQFVFEVARGATKTQIREAVEQLFDVTVIRVNVINEPAKKSRRARSRRVLIRRSAMRKAIVSLTAGQTINLFEGVK
jgi:large subunit ribosomal protein L23